VVLSLGGASPSKELTGLCFPCFIPENPKPYSPEPGVPALLGYACVQEGVTALHSAAAHGKLECLKELLDRRGVVDHAAKVRGAILGRGITW
jgi:hypothetical protein